MANPCLTAGFCLDCEKSYLERASPGIPFGGAVPRGRSSKVYRVNLSKNWVFGRATPIYATWSPTWIKNLQICTSLVEDYLQPLVDFTPSLIQTFSPWVWEVTFSHVHDVLHVCCLCLIANCILSIAKNKIL